MLTVQKFGGSSLADAEGLCRAAALCIRERQKGRDTAMVVSAMGDTTDELLAMAYSVSSAPSARELDALMSTGECSSAALVAIALEAQGQRAISLTGWQSGIFTDAVHGDAQISPSASSVVSAAAARRGIPRRTSSRTGLSIAAARAKAKRKGASGGRRKRAPNHSAAPIAAAASALRPRSSHARIRASNRCDTLLFFPGSGGFIPAGVSDPAARV